MSEPIITIEDNPPEKDIRVLWDGIGEYNFSKTGLKGQAILVFLRTEEHQVIGGAYGWANFGCYKFDEERKGLYSSLPFRPGTYLYRCAGWFPFASVSKLTGIDV
jgi:hypothetical protein